MNNDWLYIVLKNDDKKLLTCVLPSKNVKEEELKELEHLIDFYKQNYSTYTSHFEEGADAYCENIKEVRGHIIDKNI